MSIKEIIAVAIANARVTRRGSPPIKNFIDFLPKQLKYEIFDDADNILKELNEAGYKIISNKDV